jgi:hypothetical protein
MALLGQRLRELFRRSLEVPGRAAHAHAMRLLMDNLSPAQRDQFASFNYFDVIGGDTGTRYRIHFGNLMNVEALDERGRRKRMLCFMPEGRLPVGDTMLAQKIALELFENEAVQVANAQPAWDRVWERPPYGFRY